MLLVVGTESTWSLRALICSQLANIKVNEHVIDLSSTNYKSEILKYSPSGLVPALVTDQLVVHDSLAIVEYFNECSDGALYPTSISDRALSRSLCAEMHSGFTHLRTQLPFSVEEVSPVLKLSDGARKEISRVVAIFEQAKLPFMFESAGAVDAFYAILAYRLKSYGITMDGKAGNYQQALLDWDVLLQAIERAKTWKNG